MKLPVKLLMILISLVSVIARAGEYKNYSRDEIKYWRYTSYKGGKLPEGFTDEKFSSAIYNGRIFTMKRLHTLMLFLAVLFTGFNFNAEAATVKQALRVVTRKPGLNNLERVHQRTSCTKVTLPTKPLSTKH
ncbi:Uncharacterised protein [Escherichia coli]|nr:Uncharacterised protein [Escherichia coli]